MDNNWLQSLQHILFNDPIVVLKFPKQTWARLYNSNKDTNEFSFAKEHDLLTKIQAPRACLIFGGDAEKTYIGYIASRSGVTTLETRIKVNQVLQIEPTKKEDIFEKFKKESFIKDLKSQLKTDKQVVILTPIISIRLIESLASVDSNKVKLQTIANSLSKPTHFNSMKALVSEGVKDATSIFGATAKARVKKSYTLEEGKETPLTNTIPIIEDNVINYDAKIIEEYNLIGNDLTGKAVFENRDERMEVYTAHRGKLEELFGVDLIYVNVTKKNIVMLQYKMLDPVQNKKGKIIDWIFYPDAQFKEEILRMKDVCNLPPPEKYEYRLNPAVFYLKFVKRDGAVDDGNIIVSLDHYEQYNADDSSKGPNGGVRISYNTLGGRYMRQTPFVSLVSSGYIGAYASATEQIKIIIEAILKDRKALVAAFQYPKSNDRTEDDALR